MQDFIKSLLWHLKESRRLQIAIPVLVVVVVAAVGTGYFVFRNNKRAPVVNVENTNVTPEAERQLPRAIDGVLVSATKANNFPVAVMIDNQVDARPQSGVEKANIVYEVLAEGGITRLLAIFASSENVVKIGPIRSTRPYFAEIAQEYGALYAHVGGSPQALDEIKQFGIFDLNQFYNGPYFWRAEDRAAPHNVYTSSNFLSLALRDKKAAASGSFSSWLFKKEDPSNILATDVLIDFSTRSYQVSYKYDSVQNDYVRWLGGQEYKTESQSSIRVKNVVIQRASTSLADEKRLDIQLTGSGEGYLLQDGRTTAITWKKQSRADRTRYYFLDNREVQFNPGTTWVEIATSSTLITGIK